jgi:hypothetical protein
MKIFLFIILVVQGCLAVLPLDAQSLADFARRQREQRQQTAAKVYTNSDLLSGEAAPASATPARIEAPGTAPPARQQATAQTAGRTDNRGRDEKYWRNAFQTARQELQAAESHVRIMELRVNELNRQLLTESSMYNREYRMANDINAANAEYAKARQDLELARRKITDLEDELRRSNGMPGWAR